MSISPHYPLFEHMSNEHDLTLTENELQEIVNVVRSFDAQTQELIEQNSELVEMLSLVCMDMEERGRAYGDAYTMSKELLTKTNHLNSNTNETDKI